MKNILLCKTYIEQVKGQTLAGSVMTDDFGANEGFRIICCKKQTTVRIGKLVKNILYNFNALSKFYQ